ncbi:Integrase catalytic core protein [Phytophthora palmivora]|uniref:Integrase catalytic core protein n=1 Tax=Phytophthora palmivora TaxID=4796 RepID=A0A2P4XY06_9STRA|nr:Integrase catalytic core protein [Phytophthora palmivora]
MTAIKAQQAHAAIVLNMKDSQLMHVIDAATAREAWTRLENFHRTQDMANRLWLEKNFASFKYTTSSIKDHVMELETLVLKMRNANCGPSEEDVCATMLRSLPASYESLVQAFRMSMTTFSLADLVSKLIAEEVRQKDSTHIEVATALIANKNWVMDSGASAHMCKSRKSFSEYTAVQNGRSVLSAKSSAELKVIGFGTVILQVRTDRSWINAKLENVLHVQDLNKNLFSLTAVTARGMTMTMDSEKCVVKRGDHVVATGRKQGKLMYFLKEIRTTARLKIKVLRSDNGGEYWNKSMKTLCDDKLIKHEFTVPHNPEQNGIAERTNRTLVEMTRCMLKESGLDKSYCWSSSERLDHMRVFGTECYAHVPKQQRKKLDDTGVKCVFLGYAKQRKAYRLLEVSDGSIVISRSVTFAEAPLVKVPRDAMEGVFDITNDDDAEEINNEAIPYQRVDPALPEEMAKKSGWYDLCANEEV